MRPKGGPPAAWQGPIEKFPEPKTAKFNAPGNYRKDVALTPLIPYTQQAIDSRAAYDAAIDAEEFEALGSELLN